MATEYDFIVVGAGASGCVVASRLANSTAKPSVLLLEAGGENSSAEHTSGDDRFKLAFDPDSPLNWSYKTAPQIQLAAQQIDYSRGKGLGGSTAINFCAWTVGPRDDYDEWARIVRDEDFGWESVKGCLKKIERVHPEIPDSNMRKYINPSAQDHGKTGNLDLTYGDQWRPDLEDMWMAVEQSGLPTNPDINSGDPIGMGMGSVCIYNGKRLTSATAYLANPPANLSIVTDSLVARIIFEGALAIGVETLDGKTYRAKKEVVVSGGAINTPQLLLLSGIGPTEELEKHDIHVVKELPMVGKGLQDHCMSTVGIELKRDPGVPPADRIAQCPTPMGFFKLPSVHSSDEFQELPEATKQHMLKETVPTYELSTHLAPSFVTDNPDPANDYIVAMALINNPQSVGTVTLATPNPSDAPIMDPNYLTHPFDRRVMIEAIRNNFKILSAPIYEKRKIRRLGPADDSDEAIWDHIRRTVASSWHMSCTAKMGTSAQDSCVDSNFKVFGIEKLRIVDLSVCPFIINNHVQSTAYILGEIAAKKLTAEYGLANLEAPVARL